jgi:hypothetical protein
MALLALTAQQLPAKPPRDTNWMRQDLSSLSGDEWQLLYQRLDGDPEALEFFLRRERQAQKNKVPKGIPVESVARRFRNQITAVVEYIAVWVSGPRVRYFAAFGVVAFATMIVLLQMPHPSFTMKVEQAFASVTMEPPTSVDKLVLPWEHPPTALGFAAGARNDSVHAQAFARGLVRGKQRLLGANTPIAVPNDDRVATYAALGEWNVLLWAMCEATETPNRDFWHVQTTLARELAAADYAVEDMEAISKHLSITIDMLEAMASGDNSKRNARRLADELTRFREEIAPSAPDAADRLR